MKTTPSPDDSAPVERSAAIRNALVVIAVVSVIGFLHYAKEFMIPVALALVFSAVLEPLARRLRALRMSPSIAAGIAVLFAMLVIGGGIYLVSDDFAAAIEKLPAMSKTLKDRANIEQSAPPNTVKKLSEAAKNLEDAASTMSGAPTASTKPVPRSQAQPESRPNWLRTQITNGSTTVLAVIGQILLALLITYFVLGSGPMLRRKLLRASGSHRRQRDLMRRILLQSCKQVQMYVVILLATNVAVGLAVWPLFHLLGFEQPALWAFFAGVVHIVPYVGSMAVAFAAAVISYLGNPDLLAAVNTGLIVLAVVSLVATFLSTWLQSRTSRMNQVAVFIGIMFWGWLWGLWGLLLGAPIVVIGKVICDNVPSLRGTARLLGE